MRFLFDGSKLSVMHKRIRSYAQQLEDDIQAAIASGTGLVQSGAWNGEDADIFSDRIEDSLLPKLNAVIVSISGLGIALSLTSERVVHTQKKITNQAVWLQNVFDGIPSGASDGKLISKSSLSKATQSAEASREEARNRGDSADSSFSNANQKSNQQADLVNSVLKTMKDARQQGADSRSL